MTEPTIHDQEHLLDELKKPSIEQQIKEYARELDKARKLEDQSHSLAEYLETISALVEEHQHRLCSQAEQIRNDATVKVSPRAHKVYWDKWQEEEFGSAEPPNLDHIPTYPTLDKIREDRREAERKLLRAIGGLSDTIGETDREFDQKLEIERRQLSLPHRRTSIVDSLKQRKDATPEEVKNLREELKKKRKQYDPNL